jgi:hypothetical protein
LTDFSTGHTIGFAHEHQRSDADRFLKFDCEAVIGYKEAKARVDNIGWVYNTWHSGMSAEQKMEKV